MNVEPTGAIPTVTGAIRQAARMTGADFKYLLATAQVESNLNPNAQVATSSAKGLFQFIDQTWLATLKQQGPALGYAPYADAISKQPSGDYVVSDPRMSDAVMNLRSDPAANALMAGAFTKVNAGKLAARLGRDPTEGELYIAHFLGSTGASRLIALADTKPQTSAAAVFPGAARANRSIFFDSRGNARSANDVYRMLVGRYDVARGTPAGTPTVADNQGNDGGAFTPGAPLMTEAYAAAARLSSQAVDNGPVFHGLFRSSGSPEPVAPVVQALWNSPAPAASASPPAPSHPQPARAIAGPEASPPPSETSGELGLFQEQVPDARALFRGRV